MCIDSFETDSFSSHSNPGYNVKLVVLGVQGEGFGVDWSGYFVPMWRGKVIDNLFSHRE